MNEDTPKTYLEQITTRWPLITNPMQFVMRYAPAIRKYMSAIIRDPHDLEDVIQEFLLKVMQSGMVSEQNVRGRFRDYLKAAIRNAALSHLRKRRAPHASEEALAAPIAPDVEATGEREWIEEWRGGLLARAMEKLEEHERQAPDGRLYTVLSLAREHPDADSKTLATLATSQSGRPMSPEAYRKQLSRARTLLAGLLVDEVRKTLDDPSPDQIDDELAALGLQELVRPYLTES